MKKIIIVFLCFLLSGCYDYVELNKLAIVSSIGIDKKNDLYEVSVQVMNAKEDENSNGSQVTVYSEKANTIVYALRKIALKSPRKLNGSHVSKLVLSKEVANENIINVLDEFERLGQAREEIDLVIVDNASAKKVLTVLTETQNIPAEYVKNTIESGFNYTSLTTPIKADEFVSNYLKKYSDSVIPVIKIINYDKDGTTLNNIETSDPITKINVIDKLAITKDGKVVDYISGKEVLGYNFINNNIKNSMIELKCDNNNYFSVLIKSKTKYKSIKEKNKYKLSFNINVKGDIAEYNCNKELNDDNEKLEEKLKKEIKKYINKVMKYKDKSDFLGLKRKVYLDNSNYNDEKIIIKTNINIDINKKGQLNNSLKGEKNEQNR